MRRVRAGATKFQCGLSDLDLNVADSAGLIGALILAKRATRET